MAIGDVLPPMIDRAAPENWQWPKMRAAGDLGMSTNDVGQRLLRISDPDRWHDLVEADRLVRSMGRRSLIANPKPRPNRWPSLV